MKRTWLAWTLIGLGLVWAAVGVADLAVVLTRPGSADYFVIALPLNVVLFIAPGGLCALVGFVLPRPPETFRGI